MTVYLTVKACNATEKITTKDTKNTKSFLFFVFFVSFVVQRFDICKRFYVPFTGIAAYFTR
jgi:hypothetical protein